MNLRTLLVVAGVSSALSIAACASNSNNEPRPATAPGSNDPNAPPMNQSDFGGNVASDNGANPATPVGTAISSPMTPGGTSGTPSGHFGGPASSTGLTSGGARAPIPTGAGGAGGSGAGGAGGRR